MTTQNSEIFNDYQQQALSALGLTLWRAAGNAATNAANNEQSGGCYYQLGQWLLIAGEPLQPRTHQWQYDFIAFLSERAAKPVAELTEALESSVSHWSPAQVFDLRHNAESSTEVMALKRRLWQQLCQPLKP